MSVSSRSNRRIPGNRPGVNHTPVVLRTADLARMVNRLTTPKDNGAATFEALTRVSERVVLFPSAFEYDVDWQTVKKAIKG